MTPEHTISALCRRSRDISLEKGWLNPDGTDPRPFHTVISLFHSELSEAFEDIRSNKGLAETYYALRGAHISREERERSVEPPASDISAFKPCGFPTELADFVIRVAQYYGSANLGDELAAAVQVTDGLVGAATIEAEQFITQLHAAVSRAWAASAEASLLHMAAALMAAFDFCQKNGIDLWAAIDEKEAYNRTRSHKHGGKKM